MIVKYDGVDYECDRAVKGQDWIQCYIRDQASFRFSGIADFSKFSVEDGEFEDPAEPVDIEQLQQQIALLQQQIELLTSALNKEG